MEPKEYLSLAETLLKTTPLEGVKFFEKIAASVEAMPEAATAAMVRLAQIFGEGEVDGVASDQGLALAWAEKAAMQDSPEGYNEIALIAGSACVASSDIHQKAELAAYVSGTCDIATLARHAYAPTALHTGTVCYYMSHVYGEHALVQEMMTMRQLAQDYFSLTCRIDEMVPNGVSHQAASEAQELLTQMKKEEPLAPDGSRKVLQNFSLLGARPQ